MKIMNQKKIFFITLFFLTSTLACVVPGIQGAATPAPVVEAAQLSTMVAQTVSTALAQTAQAHLSDTPAPTPTATTLSGSLLAIQDDGSTFFVDQRAGYEVTIPFGWLAVRVKEQEYQDSFSRPVSANEYIQASLLSIQYHDPDKFRLDVFDVRETHIQKQFVTNLTFAWNEQDPISLDTDEELQARAAQARETLPGLEILSTSISATTNAIPFGVIESQVTVQNSLGADMAIFQKQVIFNAKTGSITITLSTVEELKATVFPEVDAMLQTLKRRPE
jgi:hypothetical protein